MKTLILPILLISYSYSAKAQNLQFTDPNFKTALVNTKCVEINGDLIGDEDADINNDNEIDVSEALKINRLIIKNQNISELREISNFINLTYLNISANKLTSLNVNDLEKLEGLECQSNQLDILAIDKCPLLQGIICSNNKLTELNIKNAPYITTLDCAGNKLKVLDLSNMTNTEQLLCEKNQLSTLNLSALSKLWVLYCYENNLTSLLLKTGKRIDQLNFEKNANLSYICCDEKNIAHVRNLANIFNYPNLEINSYCSFSPGGKYYTIKGLIQYDADGNGCSTTDKKIQYVKFSVFSGSNKVEEVISDNTGNYKIDLQEGSYSLTPVLENSSAFIINPIKRQFSFPGSPDTVIQDFCVKNNGIVNQTKIKIIPLFPPARPGFNAKYKVIVENAGNQTESGSMTFKYDDFVFDYIDGNPVPSGFENGKLLYNYSDLLPFTKREYIINLKLNSPSDVPPVNVGDIVYISSSIKENSFTLANTVVGSYDPNDKTCLQGKYFHPADAGKNIDYIIRFENKGNFAAENVVIRDILDDKFFDINSLRIIESSHKMYTRIINKKVEFVFENIQLPFEDNLNDGFVAFTLNTKPTLAVGNIIRNQANIFFDYNLPIQTNEAQTTVAISSSTNQVLFETNIYPNPVDDILILERQNSWKYAKIYDTNGKTFKHFTNNINNRLDVKDLSTGVYFLQLINNSNNNIEYIKFIKS
ncbi:MAG: T9SS type A sorting domain-containing protein [Saprospiraceae bacterium]|nr:T9SS type A sorting domain-containing protein [Saprospiraceae bacterium]